MIDELDRISKVQPLIKDLYQYAKKNFGFDKDVTISVITDNKNAKNPLGKTAFYDPSKHKVCLYIQGRHVKDIMRSLAHELVHHTQNCRGEFNGGVATVDGYAQEDDHLRAMERQAYDEGNMCFRDWEDGLKAKTKNMGLFSDTKPLGEKLMENKINKAADETLVREVVLVMTNDGQFYERNITPWIKNFRRKIKRGVFDPAAAQMAFEKYVGLAALKKYSVDQAADQNFWRTVPMEDRKAIGREMLEYYMEEIEYDDGMMNESKLRNVISQVIKESIVKRKEAKEARTLLESLNEQEEVSNQDSGDLRSKARMQTHDALMERWGYTKK
jgi:hypothetical protein